MDVHAHMPGQISVQVPDQGSSKLPPQYGNSLVPQMQNIGAHNMDHDLLVHRRKVQEIIIQSLMRSRNYSSGQWELRVQEVARKLEERIFKNAISKEEYMNITPMKVDQKVDQHLQAMMKTAPSNNQQSSHHIMSSSAISTMMPTPGMLHSGNTVNSASSLGNSMLNINGATMVQLPIAKGSVGVGNMSSYNASNGSSSNGYQLPPINLGHNSSGNSMMSLGLDISRESSQMIPTPGINNPQLISVNSEYSSGDTTSSLDSTVVSHQPQPKQYFGTQNNHLLHGLEDQRRIGMRSNLQDKASPYGLSNGSLTGGSGLIGNNNMLAMSGPDALLDGSTRRASYGISQKPFSQLFDGHHPLQVIPNHGYQVNTATMSDPKTLYNTSASSSVASAVNISQKVNSMSLHQKLKTNHTLVNRHASLQSSQQTSQIQPQMYDSSQHMKFQTTQLSKEHLLRSQNQMQNFQHQQFQQPNQLYDPHHNNSQLNQQIISKADGSRSSTSSNSGGHFMQEFGIESYNELLISQSDQQFQMPGFQNQYQQKTTTDTNSLSKISQFHSQLSCQTSPQDFQQSLTQQQVITAHNEFNHLLDASQLKSQMAEQQFHDDFQQRINGQDEAQQSLMSEGCMQPVHVSTTETVSVAQLSSGTSYGLENPLQQRNYHNQRRWLLFLLHSRRCSAPNGSCLEVHCVQIQKLWLHMQKCKSQPCGYTYCSKSKQLLRHYHSCQMEVCPVCTPVRKFIATHRKSRNRPYTDISVEMQRNEPRETDFIGQNSIVSESIETGDILKASSPKRLKAEHSYPSSMVKTEISRDHLPLPQGCQQADLIADSKPEAVEVKIETLGSGKRHLQNFGNKDDDGSSNLLVGSRDIIEPLVLDETDDNAKQETMIIDKEIEEAKLEAKQDASVPQDDPVVGTKSGKPKIIGVSMTELFTPEQIREHIVSLRQWVGQSKAKAEKNQAMERSMNENSCQLCAVEKLTFEPPPIYCTPCGVRIKRNAVYYTIGSGDTRYYFCIPCYNEARGDTVEVDGSTFLKARLEKKRNDDETEEWWVQCDKCEAWQHQVCALFNGRRNDGGQAEYTCPNCYMAEIKEGERKPLPQNAVLGAKDLPRTVLSDHIEQRLFRRMKHERQERARHLGKNFDEVPGAEALVVRVVSSVDKKLEVKQRFLEMFQEENYPTEFPYKSKVVLLFQRIEGVEVCLFGMYVQEFGSECQYPNHRRVYLSYLDSVKYFRPEIKTVTGEALRTFVYHEILIGYLEYCKKRGFASCYIWACPPLKGEDYILYCHPEIQKTPKSDKLREWYLAMLRKAGKENIVVELTNLYDHFFVTTGECKAKVTAARLPYFDGDYWPGAAEDMINQLRQEEDGRKQLRKGKTKKTITKRALKAAGQSDLSANASKDALLMHKLGETISPMKEDFIMVHLQHSCTHCCLLLVSGTNWICNQCKNFQLCQNCHDAEQRLDMRDRHPINSREKHELFPVPINGVPSDTKDKDEILESEFFDTRQAFLSLCQGNHYQYDTLRRAKHSSMMVLYHLHNPTAPAFVTTCSVCLHDIEAGQSWHCEICNDFDVCNNCYHREGGVDHPHKLSNHPSNSERDAQNKEAREQRVLQLRKMLDLLVHASQCRFPHCQYPNCRKVKGLFRHGIQCKTRASGGCALCKRMWYLLQLHARACKQSECHVPRCKDLKEHLKRSQQQSDSRRRAAVMEMMRQRAAEVQGGTN